MAVETLFTIKKVELLNKNDFLTTTLDKNK